jgi:hypothetical protein
MPSPGCGPSSPTSRRAVDTAGAVTFTTATGADDEYLALSSDRRTDGLLLDALLAVQPTSDLIPKVVAGLLAAQTAGRWDNVQENAFILLALKHYFDTAEKATPDFVARVWLGDRYAGDQTFSGRSTDRNLVTLPTAQLLDTGDADLTISKEGAGRLYYRIGLRTAPTDLHLGPLDRGFVVARTYEGVDDAGDVSRDADGTWHVKAGARVRVRLTMVAESQRRWPQRERGVQPVVSDVVRSPEPARRARRGVRHVPVRRHVRLRLRRAGHHTGFVRDTAGSCRRDLRAGDVRSRRHRHRRRRLIRSSDAPPRERQRAGVDGARGAAPEWNG